MKNWSEVAASASDLQEQAREIRKGVGTESREVRWCDNGYIVRAGMRKLKISPGESRRGWGDVKEAPS